MIVDCHTHYGICWADRDADDPTHWFEIPDRYGVEKFILCGHYNLHRLDLCSADNDRLARVTSAASGRFFPAGTAWPQMGPSLSWTMARAV